MSEQFYMGIDVGGSHITLALIKRSDRSLLTSSLIRKSINTNDAPCKVLACFESAIRECAETVGSQNVLSVGLAIPGPFNYAGGVCRITPAQQKYERMFGVNFRISLSAALNHTVPVFFNNDAACFAMGEYFRGGAQDYRKAIVITLGTGFGASFLADGVPQTTGSGVAPGGELWDQPWRDGIADDHFTTRGIVGRWREMNGTDAEGAREIADAARNGNRSAQLIFNEFGSELAEFITPWLNNFEADAFVIGGNIALNIDLFNATLTKHLNQSLARKVAVRECLLGEKAPIYGAALAETLTGTPTTVPELNEAYAAPLEELTAAAEHANALLIDGKEQTDWHTLTNAFDTRLRAQGVAAVWFDLNAARNEGGQLEPELLADIRCDTQAPLSILYGRGASQVKWSDAVLFTL